MARVSVVKGVRNMSLILVIFALLWILPVAAAVLIAVGMLLSPRIKVVIHETLFGRTV
jgi:hypothetical protein